MTKRITKATKKNTTGLPKKGRGSLAHDDVGFRALDLRKLDLAPQRQFILRLLSVLNDLDAGTYLSDLLTAQRKTLPNLIREKWRDGIVLYLLRQQTAVVYSALYDILREMKDSVEIARGMKRSKDTPKLLWHVCVR